jgi:hypothetical protein
MVNSFENWPVRSPPGHTQASSRRRSSCQRASMPPTTLLGRSLTQSMPNRVSWEPIILACIDAADVVAGSTLSEHISVQWSLTCPWTLVHRFCSRYARKSCSSRFWRCAGCVTRVLFVEPRPCSNREAQRMRVGPLGRFQIR